VNKTAGVLAGLFICANSGAKRFTAHSQNKIGGTVDIGEHRASPVVVGAGNTNTPGDIT
jgi:hypothetical protein